MIFKLRHIIILLLSFKITIIIASQVSAQNYNKIDHVVYLIGNTATRELNESNLTIFKNWLSKELNQFSIIHLGDIIKPGNKEFKNSELELFLSLTEDRDNGKIYFIPGDKDWDNSGKNGLEMVRNLEKLIESKIDDSNIFLPSDGCPGPETIDISDNLRLIVISSQWWLHPFDKPEAPDSDCKNLTRGEFLENLEDIIEESAGKNILIAGHHPVVSNGVYGGHMTLQKHLFPFADKNPDNRIPLPFLGSLYAAYRQNVGTVRDMANEDYQEYTDEISDILALHPGLSYISAHDYNLQLIEKEEGFQIISGSLNEKEPVRTKKGALFAASQFGFTRLEYDELGNIIIGFYELNNDGVTELFSKTLFQSACLPGRGDEIPLNSFFIPCYEEKADISTEKIPYPTKPVIVSGGTYKAKGLKKIFLGSLYRTTWTEPVNISYLNLDTTKSGLTPFALGGGRQTTTLKFRADNGREYAFRSIDKNLVNALPVEFRKTFISLIVKEVTATQHPYGALAVSSLLDATDILHARPDLFVLPDHPRLGVFQDPYAGLFGMLEDRPKDPGDDVPGFMNADDVTRSVGLFRKLYDDNDNKVDAYEFGKARVFDIFIGDWGRHEDNWKWAGYDMGSKRIYYPIPRDRDHAFSRWNGVLPYLADREWAMPMIENFDYDFHDIRSLTWPGRHVDRLLLTPLDRNDWKDITAYIQQKMSDEVIDSAIRSLPSEIQPISGFEIGSKLKSRREQLADAVYRYYLLLARYVDVVGSNKHEYVEIERLKTGNVRVSMFKKSKQETSASEELIFEREFIKNETREIRIYGLDGSDIFNVSGIADKSIPVRIIGGEGNDNIIDNSIVKGPKKYTLIYDLPGTDMKLSKESKNCTSEDPDVNKYDRKSFEYNTYLPKPLVYYSGDDGLVASFGINWTRHGFRKDDYKSKHGFYARGGTLGNVQLGISNHWNKIFGNWDMGLNADYGQYFPYYHFFGLGNQTYKDPGLFDDEYYKVRIKGLNSQLFTERKIFREGYFRICFLFENYNVEIEPGTILDDPGISLYGTGNINFGGINTELYLDLRDKKVFATRGFQFLFGNTSYSNIQGMPEYFGLAESYIKYYATVQILIPATFVVKLGGSKNYGKNIPFYKYTYLGQFNNLRGYRRNRFTGDASGYLNTELRLHFGKVRNLFLPFETGLIGFLDLGKVWFKGNGDGSWHTGYGGGYYIAPLAREYVFSMLFEFSPEETLLFRFSLGFILDR